MHEIWHLLADLFFLDTEVQSTDFEIAAAQLQKKNLDQTAIYKILLEEVAPVAGKNLGLLIYPVIGVWDSFDREDLAQKIEVYIERRKHYSKLRRYLTNLFYTRLLRKIEVEKLFQYMT